MTTETSITEVLFERGTLVDLHIGKPTFQKKLRQNDLLLEHIDQKAIYLGHKKLLPPEALAGLVTLEGKARAALAARSLAFPLSGARFVHVASLQDVLNTLRQLRSEWDEEVAKLMGSYSELKEEQLRRLDEQCRSRAAEELGKYSGELRAEKEREMAEWVERQKAQNRTLYPSEGELPNLFRFVWRMFRISPTQGFEELTELSQSEIAEAQNQLRSDLRNWVRQASADMHRALGEAALNASQLLQKNNKLNPRNLRPLFEAFETFKAVDFTGASEFRQVIDNIRSRFVATNPDGSLNLDQTAEAVNGSDLGRQAFQELLSTVASLATDEVAEQAGVTAIAQTGEFSRVIDV